MALVTIIIPTYNSERTVRAALDSVLHQTFQDWECVVVDGASKDATIDIVKEFCLRDSRFRYISEKDHGIYDAFNKGWKQAQTPWVYYLGSDDALTKDGMRGVADELDEEYALVTGDVYLHRVDGTCRPQYADGFMGCHQGVIMQRKVIESMGGFDEHYRIIADYDLMVRTENAGYKAKNVRVFLANFSVGGESQKIGSQWKIMKEAYIINKNNKKYTFPMMVGLKDFLLRMLSYLYRFILSFLKKHNVNSKSE